MMDTGYNSLYSQLIELAVYDHSKFKFVFTLHISDMFLALLAEAATDNQCHSHHIADTIDSEHKMTGVHKVKTIAMSPSGAGAHFTNNFSITIQMWWKLNFALIQVLIQWSLQNLAHGTTAGLSCHVPNFVAIWSTVIELELNEFSIEFELWWKNR